MYLHRTESILFRFQGGADGALCGVTSISGNSGDVCEVAQRGRRTVFSVSVAGQ